MKILLLEDELMLIIIKWIFKNIGHMVESYSDGQEVLDNIDSSFDLLVLDINVSNKDGFEILSELNSKKFIYQQYLFQHLLILKISVELTILDVENILMSRFILGELGKNQSSVKRTK